jgi:hypothetical protein
MKKWENSALLLLRELVVGWRNYFRYHLPSPRTWYIHFEMTPHPPTTTNTGLA